MDLGEFVHMFAAGIKNADAGGPVAAGRNGRLYQAGIGPHSESETITLALQDTNDHVVDRVQREVKYPSAPRNACDIVFGQGRDSWAVEVKMLRMMGDNGKLNDNMLMHLLSPYPAHRSALTDCTKLLESGFDGHKGIVIFGYNYLDFPMQPAIEAFEVLASQKMKLSPVRSWPVEGLIHPVHRSGAVYGWEITPR